MYHQFIQIHENPYTYEHVQFHTDLQQYAVHEYTQKITTYVYYECIFNISLYVNLAISNALATVKPSIHFGSIYFMYPVVDMWYSKSECFF